MPGKPFFEIFAPYPELLATMSSKADGAMRLGTSDEGTPARRAAFLRSLGFSPEDHVAADIIHGNRATIVGRTHGGSVIAATDALVTSEPNLLLSLTVADCLPLYWYDPRKRIAGITHAGWRGLANGVIRTTLEACAALGSAPRDLRVGIGPSIGPCHFEIGEDLERAFADFPAAQSERGGKIFLDLRHIARATLEENGVDPARIEIHPDCTSCLPAKYFSYRRSAGWRRPKEIEAMMAVIGMLQ